MIQIANNLKAPPRPVDGHKGTFGTVIIVGGSETMIGAPALCARAALRSGVGLVKIACPAKILPHVLTIEPSATGIVLGSEPVDALAQIDLADPDHKAILAVGPGMGKDAVRNELVDALLQGSRPVVLDADGLNLLAQSLSRQDDDKANINAPLVLTPHPGEYNRLAEPLGIDKDPTDPNQRTDAASLLASALNATVVLKGQNTVISTADCFAINPTGNPALATAGSGDVLTGTIASLIAQGMLPFDAARLGAYVHGAAADNWAKAHATRGLRAIELTDELPAVFAALDE